MECMIYYSNIKYWHNIHDYLQVLTGQRSNKVDDKFTFLIKNIVPNIEYAFGNVFDREFSKEFANLNL